MFQKSSKDDQKIEEKSQRVIEKSEHSLRPYINRELESKQEENKRKREEVGLQFDKALKDQQLVNTYGPATTQIETKKDMKQK